MLPIERNLIDPKWYQIASITNMSPDNVFINNMVTHAREMPERKTVYHKSARRQFPEPVADALEVVQDLFRSCSKFDTAVLKRYEGQSEAYNWHREPEEYVGNGDREMVLWTISGRAQLEVMTDGANIPIAFDCMPDSAKKLPAHTRHRVHPPDPVFGTRVLLWFGQRK